MLIRSIVPVMLSAMLLSTPALAGDHNSRYRAASRPYQGPAMMAVTKKCASLQDRFDKMIGEHEHAATANEAKAMRAYAGNLCREGREADGVAQLTLALKDIGVEVKN